MTLKSREANNKETGNITSMLSLPDNPERKGLGGLRTQGYFKSNQLESPVISVITVVFNGVEFLEQTINSVIEQSYDNLEYIIIDGGSSDGTLDIIKKYEEKIDYWVSEKDNGIYDAMNKGIKLATGKWLNFMNAGDWLFNSEVIETLFVDNSCKEKLIYGNHEIRYQSFVKQAKAKGILGLWKGMPFCHQAMFVDRELQLQNLYKYKRYIIAADYDFIFNYICGNKLSIEYIDLSITSIDSTGVSSDTINTLKEHTAIVLRRYNLPVVKVLMFFLVANAYLKESVKFILPSHFADKLRRLL